MAEVVVIVRLQPFVVDFKLIARGFLFGQGLGFYGFDGCAEGLIPRPP